MACRYKVVAQLGDGTYGSVWKAINRETSAVVRLSTLHRVPSRGSCPAYQAGLADACLHV